MVAKITYRFQPIGGIDRAPRSEVDYEFVLFGGDRPENSVGYELRRWMPMDLFPALRDAESDLARWTRSPLRPLLDRAAQTIDEEELEEIAEEVHTTPSRIAGLPQLADVVKQVNGQITTIPLTSIAVLKNVPREGHTVARSLTKITLKNADREDLERYILAQPWP